MYFLGIKFNPITILIVGGVFYFLKNQRNKKPKQNKNQKNNNNKKQK